MRGAPWEELAEDARQDAYFDAVYEGTLPRVCTRCDVADDNVTFRRWDSHSAPSWRHESCPKTEQLALFREEVAN